MNDELMTSDDVCDLLKVTKDWLYDQVQARRIPYIRLGRHLRFRHAEVLAYIDANSAGLEVTADLAAPAGGRRHREVVQLREDSPGRSVKRCMPARRTRLPLVIERSRKVDPLVYTERTSLIQLTVLECQ